MDSDGFLFHSKVAFVLGGMMIFNSNLGFVYKVMFTLYHGKSP